MWLSTFSSQKSRRHNHFYEWTEALSSMVFVMRAQKLFDIVWTKRKKHYHAKKYNKISIPRKMEEYWPNEEEVNYFSPVLLTSHGVYRRFTEKIPFRFYWEYI